MASDLPCYASSARDICILHASSIATTSLAVVSVLLLTSLAHFAAAAAAGVAGTLFSSCHQDGSVAVWDHRSGACVAHFNL